MLFHSKRNIFLFFCTLFTLIIFTLYEAKQSKVEQYKKLQLEEFKSHITKEYEDVKQLFSLLTSFILEDKFIQKNLYTYYNSNLIEKEKIRRDIYTNLTAKSNYLSTYSLKHLQIHLKNNKSFLRLNNFDMYGDDLSTLRPIINYVNQYKMNYDGFEIGKSGEAFRFAQPLFYNKEHIGSIELQILPTEILKKIEIVTHHSETLFLLKENKELRKITPEILEKYKQIPYLAGFKIDALQEDKKNYFTKILQDVSPTERDSIKINLVENKSFNILVKYKYNYILLQFVPQKTVLEKGIGGYFVSINNVTFINELEKDFKIIVVLLILIFMVVLYFIYREFETKRIVEEKNRELENSWKIVDKYVVFSKTDLNGIITEVSSAFCELSGYTRDELIGQTYKMLRHEETKEEVVKELWEHLLANKIWIGILKNKKKNGEKYWIKIFIEPLFNEQGIKTGYKNISLDITDTKSLAKVNKNLKKRIKKAVKLNISQYEERQKEHLQNIKLSSIGALAAGITHEINTPLTYIKGNFEMMKYDILDITNEELQKNLLENHKRIYDGILRISNIIETMREVASPSKDDSKSQTDIYQSLITALTMLHNKSKQITQIYINKELFDINMTYEHQCDCIISAQKQRIEQVWIVIINNALDELIKVEDYEKRKLEIEIENNESEIVVYFKDNAGGISQNVLHNIFDPFVSNKESSGIGIGLNIAKRIIDNNNGVIKAYNEEDGAVFKITFKK